jgi:hypothetical protein
MAAVARDRLRTDLVSLLHRALGVRDFSLRAARILRRAVPFDGDEHHAPRITRDA